MMKTKLNRNIIGKRIYTTIAILGEGLTEYWYFQRMKEHEKDQFARKTVAFFPDKPPPSGRKCEEILQEAMELIIDRDFVFCILDYDVICAQKKNRANFEKKLSELRQNCFNYSSEKEDKISVYIFPDNIASLKDVKAKAIIILKNMPCLEFWYYLHFENKSAYQDRCNKIEELLARAKYLSGYSKTQKYYKDKDVYSLLRDKLPEAISNADSINKLRLSEPDRKYSYSDMYILFQFLGIG
ncbi:MAG: RloB family protein [Candidatus Cloacimonetes bacterium]|nr:RloB family protein [Candidatus Cloacimonadota bacterium]